MSELLCCGGTELSKCWSCLLPCAQLVYCLAQAPGMAELRAPGMGHWAEYKSWGSSRKHRTGNGHVHYADVELRVT